MVESCWLNCSKSTKLTISVFRSGRISSSASRRYLTSPSLFWNLKVSTIQENVWQLYIRQQQKTSAVTGREKDDVCWGVCKETMVPPIPLQTTFPVMLFLLSPFHRRLANTRICFLPYCSPTQPPSCGLTMTCSSKTGFVPLGSGEQLSWDMVLRDMV